jgi:DMSO/TMAO reductase YedYZ heme-binding membrane subunit
VAAKAWHLRHVRLLIYVGLVVAIIGIIFSSFADVKDTTQGWVGMRELFGLWALALMLTAMVAGPLTFVLPWLPLRPHLILGRRALGIAGFVMAVLHVATYLGPVLFRDWRELYTPGRLWVAGLLLGLPLFMDMAILAFTSRDRSVQQLGPRKWKKLHQTVYWALPVALMHGAFVGADFGINKGPDVPGNPDAGCLIGMLVFAGSWLALFLLRKNHIRWRMRQPV